MFFEVSFAEKSVILLRHACVHAFRPVTVVSFAEKSVILLRPNSDVFSVSHLFVSFAEKSVILLRRYPTTRLEFESFCFIC